MLTADELDITEAEHFQLIQVRDMLAGDQIKHDPDLSPGMDGFNMAYPAVDKEDKEHSHCGTAMCIGGWMAAIDLELPANDKGVLEISYKIRVVIASYVSKRSTHRVLGDLFYPGPENRDVIYASITKPQAVKAIDNVLAHGEARWDEILRDNQYRE